MTWLLYGQPQQRPDRDALSIHSPTPAPELQVHLGRAPTDDLEEEGAEGEVIEGLLESCHLFDEVVDGWWAARGR